MLSVNMQKVMIFGTFDYFHPGHVFVLSQALQLGVVYVVVAQDTTVQQIKGALPKHTFAQRCAAITKQFAQIHIVPGNTNGQFLEPITTVQPDVLVFGYDQQLPPGVTNKDLGIPIKRLPAFEPEKWKSSKLRKSSTL